LGELKLQRGSILLDEDEAFSFRIKVGDLQRGVGIIDAHPFAVGLFLGFYEDPYFIIDREDASEFVLGLRGGGSFGGRLCCLVIITWREERATFYEV
jgi:hypothetical protein